MVLDRVSNLNRVFQALAHPARRAILRSLDDREQNLSELAAPLNMSFPAASKHVRVLERARLVRRRVVGRTHICRIEGKALSDVNQWLDEFRQHWDRNFLRLDALLDQMKAEERDSDRKIEPLEEIKVMPRLGTLQVATPTDTSIVMTRTFQAPRRLVWDAMTKPELVRRWMFCPPGWTWAECEMDVRVGGKFRWAWKGPDAKLALSIWGEHREVTPPAKIVHTEHMEMGQGAGACGSQNESGEAGAVLVTLELEEQGQETLMKMTISCPTKEVRDAMLASGMEQGMEAGYQQLDSMLAEQNQR